MPCLVNVINPRMILYHPPMTRARTVRPPDFTPRQRWTAAMRLADDDPPELAAAIADTSPDMLERLMVEDAAFKALVLACKALRDLPDEAWLERMRRLVRERRF